MNHTIVDTRIKEKQDPKYNNAALIADVKNAIQKILDESNWSSVRSRNRPKILVSENKKLEGYSGIRWATDLAVLSNIREEEPYAVISCIDLAFLSSADVENALIRAATVFPT